MKNLPYGFELLLIFCMAIHPLSVLAQSKPASSSKASASQVDKDLSDREISGEGIFMQRCGLCHSLKRIKRKGPVSGPSFGPSLNGLLKGAKPAKETSVRQIILKGSTKMPGFQYGLEPMELEDLIAYLKTL